MGKCLTGKLLSMVRSGMMKIFTTSDPLKPNSQLYPLMMRYHQKHFLVNPHNDLKTDSKNDNEKVMPSLPSCEPAISCFDDLDFFKDFKNEFPTIVYNDALTSKSNLSTEPILNPQHIDEFDLKDKTSLSKYNVLYFNDLFPFNENHLDDLKPEKDNDDNDIDIIQSSKDMEPLPPREQRHPFLRYQGLEYTDADIADFEERMVMEHHDDAVLVRWSHETFELEAVYSGFRITYRGGDRVPGFARYWSESERTIPMKGDLHDYWRGISTDGDFLGPPPSYTLIRGPMLRLCYRMMAHSIVGRSHAPEKLTRFSARRKSEAHITGGQFVARLAEHFGLLTMEILGGLTVITPKLPIIDMVELPDAVAGAPGVAQDAPIIDEGGQADPAPIQAPPPPPVATRTMP
ncbi:hypothetical protein Tco_0185865 [Tanacetum coccineum]